MQGRRAGPRESSMTHTFAMSDTFEKANRRRTGRQWRGAVFAFVAWAGVIVAWLGAQTAPAAVAQEVYPRHVYRVAETMSRELAQFHRQDLSGFTPPEVARPQERRPRHVLQEARQVHASVQMLRFLHGLPQRSLPPVPVRRIEPRDVRARMEAALADLRELRPIYGLAEPSSTAPLRQEIGPTDVFVRLQRVQASLHALGLPEIVPNDVYRMALLVAEETEAVANWLGLEMKGPPEGVSDKRPEDVYALSADVLRRLRRVAARLSDLEIDGGILPPRDPPKKVRPSHVLFLMRTLLAELNAVKAAAGLTEVASMPPEQVGQTPSDVFGVMRSVDSTLARIERRLDRG